MPPHEKQPHLETDPEKQKQMRQLFRLGQIMAQIKHREQQLTAGTEEELFELGNYSIIPDTEVDAILIDTFRHSKGDTDFIEYVWVKTSGPTSISIIKESCLFNKDNDATIPDDYLSKRSVRQMTIDEYNGTFHLQQSSTTTQFTPSGEVENQTETLPEQYGTKSDFDLAHSVFAQRFNLLQQLRSSLHSTSDTYVGHKYSRLFTPEIRREVLHFLMTEIQIAAREGKITPKELEIELKSSVRITKDRRLVPQITYAAKGCSIEEDGFITYEDSYIKEDLEKWCLSQHIIVPPDLLEPTSFSRMHHRQRMAFSLIDAWIRQKQMTFGDSYYQQLVLESYLTAKLDLLENMGSTEGEATVLSIDPNQQEYWHRYVKRILADSVENKGTNDHFVSQTEQRGLPNFSELETMLLFIGI